MKEGRDAKGSLGASEILFIDCDWEVPDEGEDKAKGESLMDAISGGADCGGSSATSVPSEGSWTISVGEGERGSWLDAVDTLLDIEAVDGSSRFLCEDGESPIGYTNLEVGDKNCEDRWVEGVFLGFLCFSPFYYSSGLGYSNLCSTTTNPRILFGRIKLRLLLAISQ